MFKLHWCPTGPKHPGRFPLSTCSGNHTFQLCMHRTDAVYQSPIRKAVLAAMSWGPQPLAVATSADSPEAPLLRARGAIMHYSGCHHMYDCSDCLLSWL